MKVLRFVGANLKEIESGLSLETALKQLQEVKDKEKFVIMADNGQNVLTISRIGIEPRIIVSHKYAPEVAEQLIQGNIYFPS